MQNLQALEQTSPISISVAVPPPEELAVGGPLGPDGGEDLGTGIVPRAEGRQVQAAHRHAEVHLGRRLSSVRQVGVRDTVQVIPEDLALGEPLADLVGEGDLLRLPMLQPDQITDTLHAYQLAKRGNALRVTAKLPRNVKLVSNVAGLLGGIALWRD